MKEMREINVIDEEEARKIREEIKLLGEMDKEMELERERKRKMESMKLENKISKKIIMAGCFLLIIVGIVMFSFNDHSYTIKITDKERIDNEKSKYLVFGETREGNTFVFENTDTFLRFKFNSSDIQGQLKEGNTYKLTVIGFRMPFFSNYENIIGVEEEK